MTPYHEDPWLTVYQGDCRAVLAELADESVHCVVTSPPYWGLRDYGVDDQLGLEATPEIYVEHMVAVFREVRRVLRKDGTLWLNLGDSYATGGGSVGRAPGGGDQGERFIRAGMIATQPNRMPIEGLKPKDLVGIPWRVAFALQADGWYLRSDIIWAKPNPMPESVTDRPTKSHEYLFLLSKSPRYYYDADAVREGATYAGPNGAQHSPYGQGFTRRSTSQSDKQRASVEVGIGNGHHVAGFNDRWDESERNGTAPLARNLRSVWTIATQPYPGAHFATFPRKLVEPCIKAGTSERGVCPECGAPWERQVLRETNPSKWAAGEDLSGGAFDGRTSNPQSSKSMHRNGSDVQGPPPVTTGWRPSCRHYVDPERDQWSESGDMEPAIVLDPFAGSGTTGMVAQSLSRRAILIDLNGDYLVQAMGRNRDIPLGLVS